MVCQREPSLLAGRIGKEASGFSAGCAKAYVQVEIERHLHYTPKPQWKGRLGCGRRRGQAKQTTCLGFQGAGMFGVLFEWTCVMPDEFDREVFLLWESITTEVRHCRVAGSWKSLGSMFGDGGIHFLTTDGDGRTVLHAIGADTMDKRTDLVPVEESSLARKKDTVFGYHRIEGTTRPVVREVVGVPGQ
ncbi:hypothetical protein ARMSODRAFT_979754 [Armillaria solidipes]|uniref:Uncharacterized protein n=1 Tax=Armillaria solidipes TaxID=1076256 RepID=A0A2H3AY70_9AGAR|nr:hypothetical protein ARMSODRAFT_979754 [Armillaria solidipes]